MTDRDLGAPNVDVVAATEFGRQLAVLPLPPRTSKTPHTNVEILWLGELGANWKGFKKAAVSWRIANFPPSTLELLDLRPEILAERLTLPKSEIRRKIIGYSRKVDARSVYNFFVLGNIAEIGMNGEPILDISRRELLQLYILVQSKKFINKKYFEQEPSSIRRQTHFLPPRDEFYDFFKQFLGAR